jgi:hypothetical protein
MITIWRGLMDIHYPGWFCRKPQNLMFLPPEVVKIVVIWFIMMSSGSWCSSSHFGDVSNRFIFLFGSQPQRCTNNVRAQFTSFWQAYIIDSYCFGLSRMMMTTKCGYLTSIEYRRKYQTLLSLLLLLLLLLVGEEETANVLYLCLSRNDYNTIFDCSSGSFLLSIIFY